MYKLRHEVLEFCCNVKFWFEMLLVWFITIFLNGIKNELKIVQILSFYHSSIFLKLLIMDNIPNNSKHSVKSLPYLVEIFLSTRSKTHHKLGRSSAKVNLHRQPIVKHRHDHKHCRRKMELIPWFIHRVNWSRFIYFQTGNEKNSFQWFGSRETRERMRRGVRLHKAETMLMGGVSIAQSHKHNKHFQEPIILQEVLNVSS